MHHAALIYPHQLFADHPAIASAKAVFLIEEPLLFTQYHFHRQKLILHRASMKRFAEQLRATKHQVHYVEAGELADTAAIASLLAKAKVESVKFVDPCDDWLSTRLTAALQKRTIASTVLNDPHFLTPKEQIHVFVDGKKKLFFTDFHIQQRKRLGILLDRAAKPLGGKWSFDPENRKRLPATIVPPPVNFPKEHEAVAEARAYVRQHFPDAVGDDEPFHYPTSHDEARRWLDDFVEQRLPQFGDYEDAINKDETILFHSMLTPMLNTGLLSPTEVVDAALAQSKRVPLNSLEGFVRQVIGWREFIRLVYVTWGRRQRSRNFWNFERPLPSAFWNASTGIEPVDTVIRNVLQHGYCHHIERLMILGNFMLLCEIDPNDVHRWFMELFIDAYDWVMTPNVYGMSQHADGGLMTTKPYLSGSSYIRKMSNFKSGPWCAIWDALYWRFIDEHADFFAGNPRLAVMASMRTKLGKKLAEHRRVAEQFLRQLHGD